MRAHRGKHRLVATLLGVTLLGALAVAVAPAPPSAADGNEAPGNPGVFRSITAGALHTCVRLGGGEVKCWGSNGDWQLGVSDSSAPGIIARGDEAREMGADLETVVLGTGRTAIALSAGTQHTCAILDDTTVKCWGKGNRGQLGQGNLFALPPGDDLAPVALGAGRTARNIAAGARHSCAILDDGELKCWGSNAYGLLGLGDTNDRGDTPGEMGDSLPTVDLGTGRTATAVTGGGNHTCALLDNGQVKCWGLNTSGQLGLGDTANRGKAAGEMGDSLPAVDLGTGRTATALTAGEEHTCALLDNGQVKCWGRNDDGRLGLGDMANRGDAAGEMGDALPAVDLGTERTAVAISTNSEGNHTCAVLDDGTVKCWGRNAYGQLGIGETGTRGDAAGEMGDDLPVVNLGPGRTAIAVTTGGYHSCAVLDDATLKCWGLNSAGELGLGDTPNRGDAAGEMGSALPTVSLTGSGIAGRVQLAGAAPHASRGLVVALDADDLTLAAADSTTNLGTFSMAVPPGDYFLYVIDALGGYTSGFHGPPTTVTVTNGQLATADPVLPRSTGSITGTVTETGTGAPLAGVTVLRLSASLSAIEATTTTDANGHYTFADLAPGNRVIGFIDPTGAHQIRFHPNTLSAPDATPVTVTAGGTAVADGTLPTQPVAATTALITGKVTSPTGSNLSGLSVVALRASDYAFVRAATTNAAGNYELLVPPGPYKLFFIGSESRVSEWYDDHPSTDLGSANSVTAPTVANADLVSTVGRLNLTLTESGGGGNTLDWVVVMGPTGIARAFAHTGFSNATISVANLPVGNYRLLLVDPNAPALEFYANAPDYASASAFPIVAATTTSLTAVLGP